MRWLYRFPPAPGCLADIVIAVLLEISLLRGFISIIKNSALSLFVACCQQHIIAWRGVERSQLGMHADTVEAVYNFVQHFIEERHYSPNYRQIAVGCHIAVSTVARYLDHLQAQERIEYEPGMARSIRLVIPQSEKP
jgi:hypothetical protein